MIIMNQGYWYCGVNEAQVAHQAVSYCYLLELYEPQQKGLSLGHQEKFRGKIGYLSPILFLWYTAKVFFWW